MADRDRITLIIEGLPSDDGRVRFNTFVAQLQSLSATIGKLDREANEGKQASYFEIVELSYSSPVRVVLEQRPLPSQKYVGPVVMQSLERISTALENDSDLSNFDAELLEDFRALAKPVGKQVKAATLVFNDNSLQLTEEIVQRADKALAVDDECDGTLDGMLEQINVHHGANTFHIYPEIGPKKVTCHFPANLYDEAVSAVGRRVEVSGILRYRLGAHFPHQIGVTGIDVFPLEGDLPDWEDVRGLAPGATGELSSEAFVRELRDAWL